MTGAHEPPVPAERIGPFALIGDALRSARDFANGITTIENDAQVRLARRDIGRIVDAIDEALSTPPARPGREEIARVIVHAALGNVDADERDDWMQHALPHADKILALFDGASA